MKRVLIILLHDDISYVSDRSLRDLLKQLSKAVRRAQLKELEGIIRSGILSERQAQASLDILTNKAQELPVYYLNRIRKGSLEAAFFVAARMIAYLAKDIVPKVVSDIATQNKFYRHLLAYVRGERPHSFASILKNEFDGGFSSGRFVIEDVIITETKSRIILNVELTTPLEFEGRLPEEYDEARLSNLIEELVTDTSLSSTT